MMMHIASTGPGWRTLKIERQLDVIAAPKICDELISAATREESHLLIDLDAVDAADEPGVAALIAAVRRVRAEHPRIRIAVLAHRTLLADSLVRNLPASIAEIYRDHGAAYAAMSTRAAA
jgi:anti-anti-sigma regulatory factor